MQVVVSQYMMSSWRNAEQARFISTHLLLAHLLTTFIHAGALLASVEGIGIPVTGRAGVFLQLHAMCSPIVRSGRVSDGRVVASTGLFLVFGACALCLHLLEEERPPHGLAGEDLWLVLHALPHFNHVVNSGALLLLLASKWRQDHAVPS